MLETLAVIISGTYYIGMILGTIDLILTLKLKGNIKKTQVIKDKGSKYIGKKKIIILIPALKEENIITSTIDRITTLDYPNYKVIVVTHVSDPKTAHIARKHIKDMKYMNIEVREYNYKPMTKPSALNYAILDLLSSGEEFDILGIVDAENWFGKRDILQRINRLFEDPHIGALQIRILPIYEKKTFWKEIVQLTACVEFADLYSLSQGNLFAYGKMMIKNRYTTPFLGGTGCFYSFKAIEGLISLSPYLMPFDPYDLTEDFNSSISIIGKIPGQQRIIYDPEDYIYAYFPYSLSRRIRQATRWNIGKLLSMLKINVLKFCLLYTSPSPRDRG